MKGWRGARSQRLLFPWGLCVPGSKVEARGPTSVSATELGILPAIPNTLQGLCMQMEKGRGVGAGREGGRGEENREGVWGCGWLRNGKAQVDSWTPTALFLVLQRKG